MKKYLIAVLALTMLAAMAVPAYAENYLEVKAQVRAKVGQDSDVSLEPPVKAQVQAGECTQDCLQDCTADGDGEQVQFQFQQGLSEDKPVGYKYAGAREPGKGAGHHFSHKHALGTVEEAVD